MKLSRLLAQREALLRQARLANLAFAYERMDHFVGRIQRARLTGEVTLRHVSPDDDRYAATLTACSGNQSRLEEHFTEADIMDLADVFSFMTCNDTLELTFQIEDLPARFLITLRHELTRARVTIDHAAREKTSLGNDAFPHGCVCDDETL